DRWRRAEQLLDDLDDDKFVVRGRAMRELGGLGDFIVMPLRQALTEKQPPEKRWRIEQLLRDCAPSGGAVADLHPERRRWLRCVEVLERLNDANARSVLAMLAALPAADLAEEARSVLRRLSDRPRR